MEDTIEWLHISDLHLCPPLTGWDADRILSNLIDDIKQVAKDHSISPDLIFFTGDAAYGHLDPSKKNGWTLREQFNKFKDFTDTLRRAIPYNEVPLNRVFIIPGNHDTDQTVCSPYKNYIHSLTSSQVNTIQRDATKNNNSGKKWRELMVRLQAYHDAFSSWKHLSMDYTRCNYAVKIPVKNLEIGIVGLNTAWCCTDIEDQGHLWIGSFQLDNLFNKVKDCDLRIALTHHPDNWFHHSQNYSLSEHLTTRFHFRLHGHDHADWVRVLEYPTFHHICIAAGALYLDEDRLEEEGLGYNFVQYNPRTGGQVILRRYSTEGSGGWVSAEIPGVTKKGGWPLPALLRGKTEGEQITSSLANKISRVIESRRGQTELINTMFLGYFSAIEKDIVSLLDGLQLNNIPLNRVESIVSIFYESIEDTYIGVDSHTPSDFMKVHPFLLDHLAATLSRRADRPQCYGRHTVRILPIRMRTLINDFNKNKRIFRKYMQIHNDFNIQLLQVDPRFAEEVKPAKQWTTDLGFWLRNCTLLFETLLPQKELCRLQLTYPNEEMFKSCTDYVRDLISEAKVIQVGTNTITQSDMDTELKEDLLWNIDNLCERDLAHAWFDFVDPDKRWHKGERDFLLPILASYDNPMVFDAAMGVGCESVNLLKEGYEVHSNEIEDIFIQRATNFAQTNGVELQLTRYDWRHMGNYVDEHSYDAILVLGNSLTCLRTKQEMIDCLKTFHSMLKPGGVIIIDERNYVDMYKRGDLMRKRDFRIKGKVIYVGAIKAKPGWEFKSTEPPENEDRHVPLYYYKPGVDERLGKWQVFPYRDNEFKELLKASGFVNIRRFWDFKSRRNNQAEFITYVANPQ